ncbi:MAG: protein-export chaperone SecB [Pseudolabrys sp.]|nr:protein-export chaperone SecB [Pseudolabrys sp.]
MANGNGGANPNGGGSAPGNDPTQPQAQVQPPQLNVMAQYIKDFSFENPNAPKVLRAGQPPQINIQVAVNAAPLEGGEVEVTLKIEGKAETQGSVMFSFELAFAGAFRISNVPQESLHPVVMIECPRLLFPFAREIIATTVQNGGFPPLLLDPVDFVALYRQNMAKAQPPQATA